MSVRVRTRCDDCGWTGGPYRSQAVADYDFSLHSCEKRARDRAAAARARERQAAIDRTPKPCVHRQAAHEHGTYACYVLDRCRCVPCAVANTEYEGERIRRNAYGRSNLVDAEPVRAHIAALSVAGVGLKQLTALGVASSGTLNKIMYGFPRPDGTRRPPAKRVRRETADRILAVTPAQAAVGARVPAIGATRRLRALVTAGWSVSRLAAETGLDRQTLDRLVADGRWFTSARTAASVAAAFDRLALTAPPRATHRQRIAASRAMARGLAEGWAPPLAWDDEDIDDPNSAPADDWRPCAHPGCASSPEAARDLCWTHYQERRRAAA